MKGSITIISVLSLWIASVAAGAGPANTCAGGAPDYLVFSAGSINYNSADLAGKIAAMDQINLETFHIAGRNKTLSAIISAGTVDLQNSIVTDGGIECSGPVRVTKTTVDGKVSDHASTTRIRDLTRAQKWLEEKSALLSKAPSAKVPEEISKNVLAFKETEGKAVTFNMDSDMLTKASVLKFEGTADSLFVVNVTGESVIMRNIQFALSDGMKPGQILLNFISAKTLQVIDSGTQELGLPATILAPLTALHLWSGKVTGQVFVGDLMGNIPIVSAAPDWQKLCSIL